MRAETMNTRLVPRLLRKIDIRYRLITSFILVSLIPLLISGVIFYLESSRAIQEKTRIFTSEVVKQAAQNVQLQMERVASSAEELSMSESMQNTLDKLYMEGENGQVAARAEIPTLLLERYGALEYVNQKYVLDRRMRILDSQVFAQLGNSIADFVDHAPETKGRPYWGIYRGWSDQKSIAMVRRIHFKDNDQLAGYLFIGLKQSHFSRIFDAINLGAGASVFVLDVNDGTIIVRPDNAPARAPAMGATTNATTDAAMAAVARPPGGGAEFATPALTDGIRDALVDGANSLTYRSRDGMRHLATFAPIPQTTWAVVSTVPVNLLTAEVRVIKNKIILIGLLCFMASLLLSYLISTSISVPLEKLVGIMQRTESGNYQSRMEYDGNDEIGVLAQKFNEMAGKMHNHNESLEEQVAARTRELEDANRQLEWLSITDGLTGLANRRRFDQVLDSEMRRATRSGHDVALIMLDVDLFKKYNDCYGHQAGDACLRGVAQALQSACNRAGDLVARYGGEEFVLVAADTGLSGAAALAETLRASVAALQLPHRKSGFGYVTISVGVAVTSFATQPEQTPDSLLQIADQALYRAKSLGRNRVVVSDSEVR